MKSISSILYYLFFFFTGLVLISIAGAIWLFTFWWDRRMFISHAYTQLWSSFLFFIVPGWKISVSGKEKINNKKPHVFVSNHQSEFDIIVVSRIFSHFKWVSKSEVFKYPIIGWNMRMNRYIELKRGDRKSIVKMIKDCDANIKNGSSVFIFPEGTRSLDGLVKKMASGAFVIAQRAKVDIQPIALSGTKDIMLKGDWKLNFKANVKLKVLDAIPYEHFKNMTTDQLAEMVRETIAANVEN
ncbi:MAG: 1-acyl-sn-glycerol-3-phosphate acyltransferase [Bacteroidales bacterium]|nr:1-acyl-sn-glycerol-3-phosphate acyltransferase [Bacteroidales bacterium]